MENEEPRIQFILPHNLTDLEPSNRSLDSLNWEFNGDLYGAKFPKIQ